MAEDLSVFFGDPLFTVPVVTGSTTTTGILNQADQDLSSGLVMSRKYVLLMRSSDFSTEPVAGDSITVDSIAYTVNQFQKIDDGKLCQLELSKT